MITRIEITGVRYSPDITAKRYVMKKIGRLDRYLARHARKSTFVHVKLEEVNRSHGNKYECEVVMTVPGATLTAKDSTLNMLAAVDIVEAKLRNQLKKYKDGVNDHRKGHNLIGRIKRRIQRPQTDI